MPSALAAEFARSEIDRLNLDVRMEYLDPLGRRTAEARLFRDGVQVAIGLGKGADAQGNASALFEALERYLMSAQDNRRYAPGGANLLSAAEVASQPDLRADLVVQRWATEFPEAVAACAKHRGAASAVFYPLFLTDPRYFRRPLPSDSVQPYRSLLRYASSLGTAAGMSAAEAAYHGLCELIEHDGVSLALLRWFIARTPGIDVVDPTSLPHRLHALYLDTVQIASAPVHLMDVTTDIEVPVYLAVSEVSASRATCVGAGASPSGAHAAERALSELIQTCALTGDGSGDAAAGRLGAWPALQRCARLPVEDLLAGPVRRVALRDGPDGDVGPEWGLEQARRLLSRRGIEFFVCEVAPPESLIAVATVIAPGLERFSLVRLGVPVIPTGRGMRMWPRAPARVGAEASSA
jgi:ribosomal protein S12 methylthiotransferase accessory factor